ncbi:MAG: GerMN domain-containing protein [Nitrospiraceae bacterium]|nr:GerMN domain-containing protein [Nitrospiraceae bacterium]
MQNRKRTLVFVLISVLLILFAGGLAGYVYFVKGKQLAPASPSSNAGQETMQGNSYLKIYYPVNGYLQMEERIVTPMVMTREEAARATVTEYLKGPAGMLDPAIPPDTRLLGAYFGIDGVLYVNLSDAFRRNFQGDALTEYLLLRGLYESLLSNVKDIKDVRVLVEGKEIETIGGHILANVPLGSGLITNSPQSAGVGNGTIGK